ncbi:PaaD-like zinc ribbon domain-containing protein [Aeribacillus composti]|uniref:PaaD-like zinc ribbon domain-containing protein n=1 Tax=Aeribacillus TaxID=1055323 RepID=UPI003BB06A71
MTPVSDKYVVHCSFCDSTNVKKIAVFGTAQLVSQYYCNQCKSVFEFIRWQNDLNKGV